MSADVSIVASLTGFDEAIAKLRATGEAQGGLTYEQRAQITVYENLKRLSEEHNTTLTAKTEATRKLKEHTSELVQEHLKQQQAQEFVNSAVGQGLTAIGNYGARMVGIGAIIATTVGTFREFDAANREAAESNLRLDAILKATGGTVGFTRHELAEYAQAMGQATRFDDDGIKKAMSVMLTFGNVQGEVFTSAISLAADYSELLGTDMSGAARILGRALEDPVNGMGMLGRVLGKLKPEQRETIQGLVESGELMKAQQELIQIMTDKFGGLAAEMGGSVVTGVTRLKNAWNDLLQAMGNDGGGVTGGLAAQAAKDINSISRWFNEFWRNEGVREANYLLSKAQNEKLSYQDRSVALAAYYRKLKELGIQSDKEIAENREKQEKKQKEADEEALWRQAEIDEKKFDARQKKLAQEAKEREREVAAAQRRRLSEFDTEIQFGNATLAHKREWIEQALSSERISVEQRADLRKELASIITKMDKEEYESLKQTAKDALKSGLMTQEEYIGMLQGRLEVVRKNSALEKEIHRDLDQAKTAMDRDYLREQEQIQKQTAWGEKENERIMKEVQQIMAARAQREIEQIQKTTYATQELKIKALQDLAGSQDYAGQQGEEAQKKIQAALGKTKTDYQLFAEEFKKVFDGVFKGMEKGLSTVFQEILSGNLNLTGTIGSLWQVMVDGIKTAVADIAAKSIMDPIKEAFMTSLFDPIASATKTHIADPIKSAMETAIGWIKSAFGGLFEDLGEEVLNTFAEISDGVMDDFGEWGDSLDDAFVGIKDASDVFDGWGDTLGDEFSSVDTDVVGMFGDWGDSLTSEFEGVDGSVLSIFSGWGSVLKSLFSGVGSTISGIFGSISTVVSSVGSAVSGSFSSIGSAISSALGLGGSAAGGASGAGGALSSLGSLSGLASFAGPVAAIAGSIYLLDSLFGGDDNDAPTTFEDISGTLSSTGFSGSVNRRSVAPTGQTTTTAVDTTEIALNNQRLAKAWEFFGVQDANISVSNTGGSWGDYFTVLVNTMRQHGTRPYGDYNAVTDDGGNLRLTNSDGDFVDPDNINWNTVIPYASGGHSIVSKPTLFMAGENGPEDVNVFPLAGGQRDRSGGVTLNFNGPTMMDEYGMRLWTRDLSVKMARGY